MELSGVTWVVAADGRAAKVFEERVRAGEVVERPEAALESGGEDMPAAAGHGATVHQRFGHGRHGAGERAPRQEAEDRFLNRLADHLARQAEAGRYDDLVLLAPPRALGVLRVALPRAAADRLRGSAPAECVGEDARRIRERLREVRAAE